MYEYSKVSFRKSQLIFIFPFSPEAIDLICYIQQKESSDSEVILLEILIQKSKWKEQNFSTREF